MTDCFTSHFGQELTGHNKTVFSWLVDVINDSLGRIFILCIMFLNKLGPISSKILEIEAAI